MPAITRFFTLAVPAGLSTIKLDSKGCATCQITVKNVSGATIDGRGILVSMPKSASGPVEKGWVTIVGQADRRFEPDQEEVFSLKIAVQQKKGEPAPAGNYSFRLDVINVARPDDSADQSQALGFTVAAVAPKPPSKWPLIAAVAALVLIVVGVTIWLLMRKPTPSPTPHPAQSARILGVGTDMGLWTRATLDSQWVQVAPSCCVTAIAVIPGGTILGVGTDKGLWTRAALNSAWTQVAASCCVSGVAAMPDGRIVGIGLDRGLWTRAALNSGWASVAASCCVNGVAVMPDGKILGIGLDSGLWTRADLNSGWVSIPASCCVIAVTVMPDGKILGVGLGKDLWTRATLDSQWVQVPNSGSVIGVASW